MIDILLASFTLLELIAVLLSIFYVVLASNENMWCWPAAFISSAIYVYIFIDAKLYFESFLNGYYVLMAVYGFYTWNKPTKEKQIRFGSVKQNVLIIGFGVLLALSLGFGSRHFTDASLPIIDAFTTVFSLVATWMVTQKLIENWLYFILIDVVSIYLYLSKDLYITSGLFVVYIVIAIFGFVNWNKQLKISSN